MKQTDLDQVLAQMADEVPPMPADFHSKWMNAVRADAKRAPADEKPRRGAVSAVRWTRILSAAAAFVFLIGGTLLYRNSKKTLDTVMTAEEKTAAVDAAVPEESVAAGAAAVEDAETDAAEGETDAALPALLMGTAKRAEDAGGFEAAPKAASGEMNMMAFEAEESAEAYMEEAAEESAEDGAEAPEAEEAAPEETPVPDTRATSAPEAPEETRGGFLRDAGAFFTDMGDFLLAALPYLAVLAVPAVTALIIRRK